MFLKLDTCGVFLIHNNNNAIKFSVIGYVLPKYFPSNKLDQR